MKEKSPSQARLTGNIEKILIALILGSIVLVYLSTGEQDLKSSVAFPLVLSFEILLCLYYSFLLRNLYILFLAGFIILNTGYLLSISNNPLSKPLILTGEISYFALGAFMGYKTVLESLKNKDLELFGTLITVALMFPLLHHFFNLLNQDYLMVYNFALAFLLSTVIYNENLWDKYNVSEKKILTYVLVSTIAEVLFISVKLV